MTPDAPAPRPNPAPRPRPTPAPRPTVSQEKFEATKAFLLQHLGNTPEAHAFIALLAALYHVQQ